jgi:uncharacterized protein YerC
MSKPTEDKKIEIPKDRIWDLLTPSEIRMLKNRWQIIALLKEGLSIRNIAERVGVGTDTVVRVSKMEISAGVNKQKEDSNKTSWVFGKSED